MESMQIETPLGSLIACANDKGLCLLEFSDGREHDAVIKKVFASFDEQNNDKGKLQLGLLEKELKEYFNGERKEFSVSLVLDGTEFQQTVWKELLKIPYGHTRSYLQQAQALHKPESIRAVASANGMNKIEILIPCHRVIGSDGSLTGYSGGLWRKKWLLDFEMANSPGVKQTTLVFPEHLHSK